MLKDKNEKEIAVGDKVRATLHIRSKGTHEPREGVVLSTPEGVEKQGRLFVVFGHEKNAPAISVPAKDLEVVAPPSFQEQ